MTVVRDGDRREALKEMLFRFRVNDTVAVVLMDAIDALSGEALDAAVAACEVAVRADGRTAFHGVCRALGKEELCDTYEAPFAMW